MKALILAGGYATRLRPLSCTKPKLLFPVLCKPILAHTLETLKNIGIDEVILAVNYLADKLKRSFGRQYEGVRLKYSLERTALGTGGAIKKAERYLTDGTFLALNGDVLFDETVRGAVKLHIERGAVATITLYEVEEPSRFGVAVLDGTSHIERFIEKPPIDSVPSKLINAGIYIFSDKIFKYIPSGRKVSIEREVFPHLAAGGKVLGYRYTGYWADIGKIEDYITANRQLLDRLSFERSILSKTAKVAFKQPIKICDDAIIKDGVEVGPYTIIGQRCTIGCKVRIQGGILFENVEVGDSSYIGASVLGNGVKVGKNVEIQDRVILAEGVKVHDGVKIVSGTSICPYKEVPENILAPKVVM